MPEWGSGSHEKEGVVFSQREAVKDARTHGYIMRSVHLKVSGETLPVECIDVVECVARRAAVFVCGNTVWREQHEVTSSICSPPAAELMRSDSHAVSAS